MPSFSKGEKSYPPTVRRKIVGLVRAIAVTMGSAVHQPGGMKNRSDPDIDPPEDPRPTPKEKKSDLRYGTKDQKPAVQKGVKRVREDVTSEPFREFGVEPPRCEHGHPTEMGPPKTS